MMDISIVRAGASQVAALVPLFDAYRQFYGQNSDVSAAHQFLQDRLDSGESTILLARQSEVAVGFTQLYPSFSSVSMRPIWILNDLFVDPDYRQAEVGYRLLEAAADFGRSTRAVRLVLSTAIDNRVAQALYAKHGWEQDREFLHYSLPLK